VKKWNFATSIRVWSLCLVVAAVGSANAKTIELRNLDTRGSYSFTDAITFSRPFARHFADSAGFSVDDPSRREPLVTSFDHSIYLFVVLGVGGGPEAVRHSEPTAFQTFAATARGPVSFDELVAPGELGVASGFFGSAYRGSLDPVAVRETDVWVMLLVGVGVVLYQLRRKQRTLEQEPVAA
jgi:hypothetical protein